MTDPTTTDAPSLVSMLAEMRLAAVDYDERCRRGGDSAQAQAEAQADIARTERAVLDRVRGLRERAETAERERDEAREELAVLRTPRPRDEWRESDGPALWWKFPVREPPYAGTPLDDDFPGDATHWTPLPVVQEPVRAPISEHGECPACLLGECREHDAQSPCDVFVHVRDAAAIRTRDCGGDGHHLCRRCAACEEEAR